MRNFAFKHNIRRNSLLIGLALALTACGGAKQEALPTVTPIPTFKFIPPTDVPIATEASPAATAANTASSNAVSTDAATVAAVSGLDPDRVAQGKGRYEALECGNCHGADGTGTTNVPTLVGMKLSQDDFVTLMRSGGKMGAKHQYSANRLSENGTINLYQFVLSLGK